LAGEEAHYMIVETLVAAFVVLVVAATFWDVAGKTIPNWLPALMVALFPFAGIAAGLPGHLIALNIVFGAATLLGCFFLYNGRVLRGGDAKLIPGVAVWTGAAGFAPFALVVAIAGGAFALARFGLRRLANPRTDDPAPLDRKRGRLGVAIAAGALVALARTPVIETADMAPLWRSAIWEVAFSPGHNI
jgi:prepilin peptidase CpaA